jgi:hypothetical protein
VTVTGSARLNDAGKATVAGGINTVGTYSVQSVQVAPASNPTSMSTVPFPSGPPTNVAAGADSLCTP